MLILDPQLRDVEQLAKRRFRKSSNARYIPDRLCQSMATTWIR